MTTMNLLDARKKLGLTQTELAKKLGWSTCKQISNIELGIRPIQIQTELAIECLLRRDEEKKPRS